MRDFRQIKVGSKAHSLTLEIYKTTAVFPVEERYGLTSQLRRAAASVGSNIAGGFGRGGNAELAPFLQIGMGSATEVENQLLLAPILICCHRRFMPAFKYKSLKSRKCLAR